MKSSTTREQDPRRLAACAMEVAQHGHLHAAAYLLRSAERLSPGDPVLQEALAACLLDLGDAQAGGDAASAALELGGQSPYRTFLLAAAAAALGDENARDLAREASAGLPDNPATWLLLAKLELAAGETGAAQAAANNAISTSPHRADAWLVLGDVALAEGRSEDHLQALRQAAALAPESPDIRTHLGFALMEVGRRHEAQRCWVDVLSMFPDYGPAAKALSESALPRRRPRNTLLILLSPAAAFLAASVGSTALGMSDTAGFLVGLGGVVAAELAIIVTLSILQRRRIPRELAGTLTRTSQRQRSSIPPTPARQALPIALALGIPWIVISAVVGISDGLGTVLILASLYVVPVLIVFGLRWLRWRAHENRKHVLPQSFDPSVCHCPRRSWLNGKDASRYAEVHLAEIGMMLTDDVDVLSCDQTGATWLMFGDATEIEQVLLPLAVQVPRTLVDSNEHYPMGMYL